MDVSQRMVLVLAALLGLMFGPAAVAAEVEIPPDFLGIWGQPACDADSSILVYFSHGGLEIGSERAHYHPVQTLEQAGAWVRQQHDDAVSFMRVVDGTILRLAVANSPSPVPDPGPGSRKKPATKPRLPLAGPHPTPTRPTPGPTPT